MCDPKTGQCQECKVGFFGSECTMECDPSCKSCEQKEGKCKECNDGYYRSIDTESTCKKCTNCKENGEICNKTTGECFECIDDSYFGPKCEKQCSITCNDRKCFQNGTCFSCVDDHYGNTCEKNVMRIVLMDVSEILDFVILVVILSMEMNATVLAKDVEMSDVIDKVIVIQ